ncbi:hypothetical protein [Phyllobacterium sp. UNC302MFCol5.2]|uniref:hypothetical protein n=1 Tax=Phyllobacterium sp. UNC302MFCol5.2 TaxID=1449065 RepID=UPI0004853DEA|nr:hypothetical protein [Phyllobacterium sp. UNC302MFCol5.2]
MSVLNLQLQMFVDEQVSKFDLADRDLSDIERGYLLGLQDMRECGTTEVRKFFATMSEWFNQNVPRNAAEHGELGAYNNASKALGFGDFYELASETYGDPEARDVQCRQ